MSRSSGGITALFALMIAPQAMNGSAASGLPLILAKPPSRTMSSGSTPPSTPPASRRISSDSFSAAPFTASSPVTANWLAYVPEKPACEFQYESWPGRTWIWSGETPRMSPATWLATVSWPWPWGTVPIVRTISPKMSSLIVATSLFPENWSSGLRSVDWPKLFVPGVERRADPDPDDLPVRLRLARAGALVVDQLERDVEAARVVAGVVDAAVRRLVRHLLGLDVVLLPHLDRVEPELVRDDVADPLGQPELLHPRVAAVRRDRRLVRHHLREVDADVPPAVEPGRDLRPDDAAERLVARERAAVVERLDLEAEHRPVVLDGDLDVVEPALVAVRVRRVLVGAPLRPLDRALQLPREQAAGGQLHVRRDLVAEAAADVLGDEAELVERHAQRRPHPDRGDAGHLVVAVQRELAGAAVVLDERGRALERRRREPVEVELLDLHDLVRGLQRAVDVAPVERARPDDVRARVLVEDRRAVVLRRAGVDEHVERLVLDLDEVGGVAGELARLGDHGDDRLADVADAADGERVVLDLVPRRGRQLEERVGQLGDLVRRQRPVDALERLGGGDVDRDDLRVARTASGRSGRSPSRAA